MMDERVRWRGEEEEKKRREADGDIKRTPRKIGRSSERVSTTKGQDENRGRASRRVSIV